MSSWSPAPPAAVERATVLALDRPRREVESRLAGGMAFSKVQVYGRYMSTSHSGRAQAGPQAAKRPRSLLAGPYGHPFHPVLVTVPIGAWVSSIVLDVAAMAGDDPGLAKASQWLIGIGVVAALVAALFGLMDLSVIPRGTPAFKTGITHMALNVAAVVLFAVDFLIRYLGEDDSVPVFAFVLSLVGASILGASGWLGGKLAYHYGVRVADEGTQAQGFR